MNIILILTQTLVGAAPTHGPHPLARAAAALTSLHLDLMPLLAQSTMDPSINSFLDFLTKVGMLVGVVAIVYGGWNISRGETERGLVALIGGFIIATAVPIVKFLAGLGGTTL